MAALIFLMLLLLATVGCAGKTEADKIHEISLPNEDVVVMQMKFDEKQRLLIAGFERNEDNSAVTASVWRTDDQGESWESLYEKTFHSEKPGETLVETEVYFTDDGLLMSEVTFTLENISDMSRKMYYVKNFETGDTEEILTSINVNSVSDIKFISEEAVYALDYRSRDFLKINILTEEAEKIELPQIKSIIYNFYNDTCVHFAYYIEEEYLNEQELQAENIDSDDAKEIYENYHKGYAFESTNWQDLNFQTVELKQVIRQKNPEFIHELNKARIGDYSCVHYFNTHCQKTLFENGIILTATNRKAEQINHDRLSKIPYKAKVYHSRIVGDVKNSDKPTLDELHLKIGARVMVLMNDTEQNLYQNGSFN